jgi:hypothetical protein
MAELAFRRILREAVVPAPNPHDRRGGGQEANLLFSLAEEGQITIVPWNQSAMPLDHTPMGALSPQGLEHNEDKMWLVSSEGEYTPVAGTHMMGGFIDGVPVCTGRTLREALLKTGEVVAIAQVSVTKSRPQLGAEWTTRVNWARWYTAPPTGWQLAG